MEVLTRHPHLGRCGVCVCVSVHVHNMQNEVKTLSIKQRAAEMIE